MAVARNARPDRNLFENFFEYFFKDEDIGDIVDLEADFDLDALMLAGDIRGLEQSPNDVVSADDAREGWSREVEEGGIINMPFTQETTLNVGNDFPQNPQPLDFFNLFIGDEVIDRLVEQTNLYAQRKIDAGNLTPKSRLHRWYHVTDDEMRVFLALVITTGLVIKPTVEDCWCRDEISDTPFFAKNMSLVRFQAILSNFHLTDNTEDDGSDPLFKIRPFFTHLRQRFSEAYTPDENISFDEATCPWKGRLRFRVYNPAKPDRFGIKLYEACEAKSGYVIAMDIYQGAAPRLDEELNDVMELDEDLTTTTRVVMGLLAYGGLLQKGHRVFMDNYYTSPELFHQLYLMNTYACGTVRTSRHGMPETFKFKKVRQQDNIRLEQGQSVFRINETMLAVKYHDKRDVNMLSTIHEPQEVKLNKVDEHGNAAWKPVCIVDYIRNMGGVDTSDQVLKNYSLLRKTMKWWRKLFFYLFTLAICNSYYLHRKFADEPMTHHQFRKKLVRQLISAAPTAPQPARRGRKCQDPPQRLIGSHRPAYNMAREGARRQRPQRDCVACNPARRDRAGFKRKQSIYHCAQCEVTLCVPRCFEVYHSRVDYERVLREEREQHPGDGGDN